MQPDEYLRELANELAVELFGAARIKRLCKNSDLLGAYAEAAVRAFVVRTVYPLRVSRGSIFYEGNLETLPELDAIIWQASPLPPIFETGDFGLIPRGSAVGWLEVKRSMYGCGEKLRDRLELNDLVRAHPWQPTILRDDVPLATHLGVVCLQEHGQKDSIVDELVAAKKVVVVLKPDCKDGAEYAADPEALFRLTNFLMDVRLRARQWNGWFTVNERLVSSGGQPAP